MAFVGRSRLKVSRPRGLGLVQSNGRASPNVAGNHKDSKFSVEVFPQPLRSVYDRVSRVRP